MNKIGDRTRVALSLYLQKYYGGTISQRNQKSLYMIIYIMCRTTIKIEISNLREGIADTIEDI